MAQHAASVCAHDHLVEFYETEAFLVDTVRDFFVPALRQGGAAIVVATAAHLLEFETALVDAGIALQAAMDQDRYLAFDAADLLSRFMVDGTPDVTRFRQAVGAVLDRASQGGRPIRVYGEMVSLLWDQGDITSALALEDLWNDLAEILTFELLCAYPMRSFDRQANAAAFRRICEQHTTVIPGESYSLLPDPGQQSRAVARLQQEVEALRAELRRGREQQELPADLAYVDSLTALANRRAFDLRLTWEWALTQCREADSYVVVIALDQWQQLRDSMGRATGDQVLRQFAEVLRIVAGGSDIVARIADDQFAILLVGCDEAAARSFEARLRHTLAEGAWPALRQIHASFGHASLQQCGSPDTALDVAERT
jgi:diguanylate cyclase (GGDEF)-like protein